MADYDSDSSAGDDIETNVLLGYASKEPTVDDFSQLGGHPIWLDLKTAPDGALAKCKVCHGWMNLLLQLNGDLPDRFPSHERRLYVWACRRKACRRKDGSVRGFRATRQTGVKSAPAAVGAEKEEKKTAAQPAAAQPPANLGETLFGVKPSSSSHVNPFAAPGSSSHSAAQANPFATASSSLAAQPPPKPAEPASTEALPQTFAEKARLASPPPTENSALPSTPWPEQSAFPTPYPSYYIDADKEYIDSRPEDLPSNIRVDNGESSSSSSGEQNVKDAFESSMDKTFQKFADRLSQNPEQVLRYEFAGQPLLYSKTDTIGKLLDPSPAQAKNAKVRITSSSSSSTTPGKRLPRCTNCGAERVFELQLTPHGITELEAEEVGLEGMDWGTILLGVCKQDCQERGKMAGQVGYVEEWVGVQWEELEVKK